MAATGEFGWGFGSDDGVSSGQGQFLWTPSERTKLGMGRCIFLKTVQREEKLDAQFLCAQSLGELDKKYPLRVGNLTHTLTH